MTAPRRPGRPPKKGGRDEVISLRLPPAMLRAVDERAEAEGCSRTSLIQTAIAKHLHMEEGGHRVFLEPRS